MFIVHVRSCSTCVHPLQDAEAEARAAEAARKRGEDIAAGRVRMNGRELYQHEPWVFDDSRFDT